jgi:RNA polymerase sigma factor (sigma-70 family)
LAVPARELQDDTWLVRAVQGGDTEAFSELFRRHYVDVKRSCARHMACPLEAEEIAQAAFVRALERIGQCRGERQFGGWVQIIARHMCVDALRSRSRVVPSESPMSEHHADGTEPHDSLLDQEQRDDVRRALDTLPLRQRQAVTARALGTGPGQIADDLGLSVGAVDSLILRGRRRLALAYQRVAGEGGATATATSTTAAASLLAAFAVGSTSLLGGVAAAAEAGRDLVRPVATGVAGAIMSVAVAITGAGPATPDPAPVPPSPPAVVVTVPLPEAPGASFGTGISPQSAGGTATAGSTAGATDPAAPMASGPVAGGIAVGGPTGGGPTAGGPMAGGIAVGAPGSGLASLPPSTGSSSATPPGNAAGSLVGQVAGGAGGASSVPPVEAPPSPSAPEPSGAAEAAPPIDPIGDSLDATVPAVTDTVADTTEAVDTMADDTVDTLGHLLPK